MPILKLFLIFVKIGAILLGGGYVILPIMMNEFVEKRQLVSSEELVDYFAISQSLPGIIAANMSIFIGYKLHGKLGAISAIAGVTFVPFWSIVLIVSVIDKLVNNQYMQGIFWGVGVAVITLISLTIKEILQKSDKNAFFYIIFIFAFLSLLILKTTPIQTILIYTVLGVIIKKIFEKRET